MKLYAKIIDGALVTTCAAEDDTELIALIIADGFKPYDDSAPKPNVGEFQAARATYQERSGTIYISWEIIDNSPEKVAVEIAQLQSELSATDYKIIKSYEYSLAGEESPYDIEAIHTSRQVLRNRISELEQLTTGS